MQETPARQVQEAPAAESVEAEVLPPELPKQRALTTHEAALRLGVSVPWIKLHAHEIGGRKTPRGYRFPNDLTLEWVQTRVTLKRSQKFRGATEQEERDGELARKVFLALDHGTPTRIIVSELRISPETVRRLAREWIECGKFDENELAQIHGRRQG